LTVICGLFALSLISCSTAPKTYESRNVLSAKVDEAIAVFKKKDPGIKRFFDSSYGYAVFPEISKGAFVVGGAYGRGEVYEQDSLVGYSSLSQGSIGFSFGGEFFREIIFFKDKEDLDRFRREEYEFSAQITGVALTAGAAAKASYDQGMVVFVIAESGLMVDASLAGQKFKYMPQYIVKDQ